MTKDYVYRIGVSKLTIVFSDIVDSTADVLVSSDDCYLTMGGGVSAAIRRAAGESLLLEVAKKIPATVGDVVVTGAGAHRAKHVFHAVTIGDGQFSTQEVLLGATRQCLRLLRALRLSSIAFPAIGSGAAGFATADVAESMSEVIVQELTESTVALDVTLHLFDRFGGMQPIDYMHFFEELAIRTRGLKTESLNTAEIRVSSPPQHKSEQTPGNSGKRQEVLEELGELERERQQLEGRLALYGREIASADFTKIEIRLKQIQGLRISLLSEINPKPSRAVPVFVSYSHVDEPLRLELGKHLSVLERQGLISTWHDRKIGAGTEWASAIHSNLNEARVVLLLISADFINSNYCYELEMKTALERHERQLALVIPIMLRAVSMTGTPFSKLQVLPKDSKAVVNWPDRDLAFVDITEGIRNAIQDLVGAA